jgi:NAD(P)-dependent dehydrogenase (short-subunit alcohol dehydrogenase family)
MDGRSQFKATTSIQTTLGQIKYIHLDLDDLGTIKASAAALSAQESKLDVLWNNAGIANPTFGDLSKQGHLKQLRINCFVHFLLTQLLLPAPKQPLKQHPRTQFASSGPAP